MSSVTHQALSIFAKVMSSSADLPLALITGCGSPGGIGFAIAGLLGRSGKHRLVICSTSARIFDRVDELNALGYECRGFICDLTNEDEVGDLVLSLDAPVSVLVNNAGMAILGAVPSSTPLESVILSSWDDIIARNLTSAMLVTRACLRTMPSDHHSRIIFVSSTTGGLCGVAGECAYSAAKAALVGLARSLSLEVARRGITVNCVLPGWIDTASATDAERDAGRATPIGRPGTALEVAAVADFLASPQASYVTGQAWVVDGGNAVMERRGAFD